MLTGGCICAVMIPQFDSVAMAVGDNTSVTVEYDKNMPRVVVVDGPRMQKVVEVALSNALNVSSPNNVILPLLLKCASSSLPSSLRCVAVRFIVLPVQTCHYGIVRLHSFMHVPSALTGGTKPKRSRRCDGSGVCGGLNGGVVSRKIRQQRAVVRASNRQWWWSGREQHCSTV